MANETVTREASVKLAAQLRLYLGQCKEIIDHARLRQHVCDMSATVVSFADQAHEFVTLVEINERVEGISSLFRSVKEKLLSALGFIQAQDYRKTVTGAAEVAQSRLKSIMNGARPKVVWCETAARPYVAEMPVATTSSLVGGIKRTLLYLALGYGVYRALKYVLSFPSVRDRVYSLLLFRFRKPLNPNIRNRIQKSLSPYMQGVREGHPHAGAATTRNTATKSMLAAANAMGLTPYVVSPSQRERNAAGNRCYYQLNDLAQDYRVDDIPKDGIIIMTDIDYYCDIEGWLSHGLPILMYSFVPESAGGSVDDGVFSISKDEITTIISGGGEYKHKIWDYNADSRWCQHRLNHGPLFRFINMIGSMCGVWSSLDTVMFTIDHFSMGPNRRIISLVPFARMPVMFWDDEHTRLDRMKLSHRIGSKWFNVFRVLQGSRSFITISQDSTPVSATIEEAAFVGVSVRYKESSGKHLSDVVRYCGDSVPSHGAAIIYAYLSSDGGPRDLSTVHYPGTMACHFSIVGSNRVEDGKRYARRYAAPPLSFEAVYPLENTNNEVACIEKRINVPQQLAYASIAESAPRRNGKVHHRFMDYAQEFVERVVPVPRMGIPLTISEVGELQDKPMQRVRTEARRMDTDEKFAVNAFQKREAYTIPNDPRNISTCPTMHTLKLSSFTLAFKIDCLKGLPWYMPGRTPEEIATAVQNLAARSQQIIEGDYSRFDGTITEWLRVHVETACYRRWVDPIHFRELDELLVEEWQAKAYTKSGIKYEPGYSRLSGSPLTTDGNTLLNAFAAFATARESNVDADWAFSHSGIYYGDDSLMNALILGETQRLESVTRVAGTLGLQLKAVLRVSHTPLSFLSRIFIDPWTTPASFQEPLRTLSKLHTTTNATDDINQCGYSKANAYLVTDGKTPLISHWCRTYLRCLGRQYAECTDDSLPYWFRDSDARSAPWPQQDDMLSAVAMCLDVGEDELRAHLTKLENYSGSISQIPRLDVKTQDVKVHALVDGQEFVPGGSTRKRGETKHNVFDHNRGSFGTARRAATTVTDCSKAESQAGGNPSDTTSRGASPPGVESGNGDLQGREAQVHQCDARTPRQSVRDRPRDGDTSGPDQSDTRGMVGRASRSRGAGNPNGYNRPSRRSIGENEAELLRRPEHRHDGQSSANNRGANRGRRGLHQSGPQTVTA